MFLVVGVLYDRLHSREISTYGGVINSMPKFKNHNHPFST
jgi:NADH-quinone oxidoreductase subunit M